jgi:cytidine deaminase
MEPDWSALETAARTALPRAYAPYSRFPVAAAILFADGAVLAGVNVENASYPLSLCAERAAVSAGVAGGHGAVRAVLVLTDASEPTRRGAAARCSPSTALRRSGAFAHAAGRTAEHRLGALFPDAFRSESLEWRNPLLRGTYGKPPPPEVT